MTLPQNVEDRIQKLSDRKLSVWQEMASTWLPGSTAPINADAFLSLIAEVRRCRAHLMSQEAEIELLRVGCEQNLLHAQMAESRLTAANALLREALQETLSNIGFMAIHDVAGGSIQSSKDVAKRIQSHLQGAGDE